MRRVVVDASVVVASLHKEGSVRDLLMCAESVQWTAPAYIRIELERHVELIASRARISAEAVRAVLEDVLSFIELVPQAVYQDALLSARSLARKAHAQGDEEYVALSLALDAPIWTLDKDFRRISGIVVLSTADLRAGPPEV